MSTGKLKWTKGIAYVLLAAFTAIWVLFFFGIVSLLTRYFLWVFISSSLIYWGTTILTLCAFLGLMFLARHIRQRWLMAISLGGAVAPAVILVLMLVSLFTGTRASPNQKPNQCEPLMSPSGKYVLTVPIEHSGRLGFGLPFWHVTISDPERKVLYHDPEESFGGIHNVYWTWDQQDRVWLCDSDDSSVYFYEYADGNWTKARWGAGRTGHAEKDIAPPESLYPSYVSRGPVHNLKTRWDLSGFNRTSGPEGQIEVSFRHLDTGQNMWLRVGDSQNGVTLLEADWDKGEAVVKIGVEQFTLSLYKLR